MLVRRKYDAEFKAEIVRLVTEDGQTPARVARDQGISRSLLSRWVNEYREGTGWARSPEQKERDDKLHLLKKEHERLKKENEFLKKAHAFFADLEK